ncbi:hypothetical protein Mycch_2865 [Mycolicibacterium chubuense NBB4]|uniref:Uncharacterized protein n=1 Tax=Mycolicibacterium chubuense (strain NBB4) TaxID=710421 RepID=I4BK19_MYCCN|nr:hypothetical protein [Mycolicibacterium chubuense]AFM17626.1 hypothetical protein Mycch_2865 [Mycolicibacterium chubuense NBB4]
MSDAPVPRWLRIVLICDRAGSSWYIGTGFFFAPVLAVLSPWPAVTAVLWAFIAVAGLWLGLLGIAMATGLALVLRSNAEIGEDYWRSLLDYPTGGPSARPGSPTARCSRPASA